MAIYRQIHTCFWEDTKVLDDMEFMDRYFYLYLLTNPHVNQSGCYEISLRQITNESGIERKEVLDLLEKFENKFNLIKYSKDTKEILILKFYKYNWTTSPKVKTCIEKEISKVKSKDLIGYIYGIFKKIYPMDTETQEKEKEKEKEKNNKKSESKLSQESNFVAPTLADIISFGAENDVSIDYCNKFFNHYESVNWKIKGVKLINWQAKFLEWIQDDIDIGKIKNKKEYDTKMIYTERETGRDFQYDKEGNKHYVSN